MDEVIPKEKLTAYERWELAAFDEEQQVDKPAMNATAPGSAAGSKPDTSTPAPCRTPESAQEIAEAREAARQAGQAEGYASGYAEGIKAARSAAERMTQLADAYEVALRDAEGELAEELLDLALLVARQVLRSSLLVRPELLLGVVSEAMAMIPSHHGHPSLILHPSDAAMLHEALGHQMAHTGWRVVEDAEMQRGDCRVEAANSELDASLRTRWSGVVEAIGTRVDWLSNEEP